MQDSTILKSVFVSPFLAGLPDHLTVEEFWERFGRREHETLEFKRAMSTDARHAMVAMANTRGGLIVHGVDRNLRITGCPLSQKTADEITRFANECGIEVDLRSLWVGDTELTVTAVPEISGRIVTTPDGRLLRRVGGDCQPLRGDAMMRFAVARNERAAEERGLLGIEPDQLDLDSINRARAAEDRPPVEEESAIRALADLGVAVIGDGRKPSRVLLAGVVLFAKDPTRHLPGATVQLMRREGVGPGPGPAADREECRGPLPHILECCLRFVDRHTRRYEAVTGVRREVVPEYPLAAVREALLNALAHRDYGLRGATVDLTVWDDRLEIRSPGPLPGHITPENMRREHYSRNRLLMRVLKTMGLVEEYGEGVDRIFHEMEGRLMEPPIFGATSSSVTVTLRNRSLVSVEDQVWLALLSQFTLSVAERRVLVAARREGAVTRRRLRNLLPGEDTRTLLRGAVAKGLLVRTGERGGSRYELSDEVVLRAGSRSIEAEGRKRRLLLDEIESRGSLSTVEGADLLGESVAAVRQMLNELTEAGSVRSAGQTRARRYYRK